MARTGETAEPGRYSKSMQSVAEEIVQSKSARRRFEMTPAQLASIQTVSHSVPVIMFGGVSPASLQERANAAWQALGAEMGFVWDTATPIDGEPETVFEAEPLPELPAARFNETARQQFDEKRDALSKRALSQLDYDDIHHQLRDIARTDANVYGYLNESFDFSMAFGVAILEAYREESKARKAFGKTLDVEANQLTAEDRQRLFWFYLETLSAARAKAVGA